MKLVESFLGFKAKKSPILEQRNSLLKLLFILNVPFIIVLFLVNREVPEPYMDQYFHYNQFRSFYQGDYTSWDSKITTPPGLYYIQRLFSFAIGGQLSTIRCLTCLVFGNLFAVFAMKIYDFQDYNRNNIMRSLNLVLTPTIFFFNFLDYTDTVSLSLLTMSFYYCLVGSVWRMGIFSLLSVYVRQNNIIWCSYLLFYRIFVEYSSSISSIHGNFLKSIWAFIKLLLSNRQAIIKKNFAQIMVFPIFAWYLYRYNDGKLLFGDHSNHVPSFHPTQILYLSLFLFVNLPVTLSDYLLTIKESFNRIYYSRHAFATYLFLLSACLVIVDKYSLVHPFILADNRHYIFYIYRYFKWAKFPLCLVYPFCMIVIIRLVATSHDKLFKFILWVCVSLVYLMLSQLVEFRYFTIPLVMLSFEIKNRNLSLDIQKLHKVKNPTLQHRMILTTLAKALMNIVIMYMFLYRPFGVGKESRFIW